MNTLIYRVREHDSNPVEDKEIERVYAKIFQDNVIINPRDWHVIVSMVNTKDKQLQECAAILKENVAASKKETV